jgi:hypothetical protein
VENIPLYLSQATAPPIRVLINNQYEVQKVTFQPSFVDVTPTTQQIQLLDLGTVLDNINSSDEASIVAAHSETGQAFSLSDISSGELSSVTLEYRADFANGLAYPFYRFKGELVSAGGQTIQAEVITPAVKTR